MAYKYIYYNFNTIFIFERVITIIIRKAEYIISAVDPKGYPNHDLVEFAFLVDLMLVKVVLLTRLPNEKSSKNIPNTGKNNNN